MTGVDSPSETFKSQRESHFLSRDPKYNPPFGGKSANNDPQMDPPETSQPPPPPPPPAISDRVLIDGTVAPVTLTADGRLVWSGGRQRSLSVEKEVLGFDAEGPRIRIKAVVDDGSDRACCVGGGGGLARKDYVFEPLSEESKKLWCEKLRDCMDSLGNSSLFCCGFEFRFCLFDVGNVGMM